MDANMEDNSPFTNLGLNHIYFFKTFIQYGMEMNHTRQMMDFETILFNLRNLVQMGLIYYYLPNYFFWGICVVPFIISCSRTSAILREMYLKDTKSKKMMDAMYASINEHGVHYSINIIYVYSYLQLKATKLYGYFSNVKEQFSSLFGGPFNKQPVILNDVVQHVLSDGTVTETELVESYEFIVLNVYDEHRVANKILSYGTTIPDRNYILIENEPLLIELYVENGSGTVGGSIMHRIDLKTEHYNFLIKHNKFNLAFFKYYVKNFMHKELDTENHTVMLSVIDHCVTVHTYNLSKNEVYKLT
jgi:hypothetical protein